MTESDHYHFETARERLNRGQRPQSTRENDANDFFVSYAPGRNLDASTVGRQRKNGTNIRIRSRGR